MFRLINFILLAFVLLKLFSRNFREFLFRRMMNLRREMVESVVALKRARVSASESREAYESLPKDITERREAISRRCDMECRAVIDEVEQRAGRILRGAERLAHTEISSFAESMRSQMLDQAFAIAGKKLVEQVRRDGGAAFAGRALERLDAAAKDLSADAEPAMRGGA